jgi:lipid-A-disaccharide synthase
MADVFIVTGEASGDAVGARLAGRLKTLRPDLVLEGIGARKMREAGVRLFADSSQWAAIGVMQALPMLLKLTRLLKALKRRLLAEKPRVLVLVDFGAFNVRLGTWARENGIRTVYLMPPGSWRRTTSEERLRKLAAAGDLFLSPFAWNAENLRAIGADAEHIGHPALELAGTESAREPATTPGRRIALLPGSRRHEVETLAPVMARVASAWPFPEDRFTMVRAPSYPEAELSRLLDRALPGGRSALNLEVVEGRADAVFRAADLAVVCSGTATLEGAIAGVPMVVLYDGPALMRLEWRLRRRKLNITAMAIPNIIAEDMVIPELMAEDVRLTTSSRL